MHRFRLFTLLARRPVRGTAAVAAVLSALAAAPASATCPADRELMLEKLNRVRAAGAQCGARGAFPPAQALQWNDLLAGMAAAQAQWLVSVDELLHVGPRGESIGERARLAGYRYARVGENLAQGQLTLDAALQAWRTSEAHCATLFAAPYTEAAIACLPARDGRPLWVMALGLPKRPAP